MNERRHPADSLDRRLRQLVAEQAETAPSPRPWDEVRERSVPGRRSSRRAWVLAAAATLVLVVGTAVLITGGSADAPSTLAPSETDVPGPGPTVTEPSETDPAGPGPSATPQTTQAPTLPDDEAPGDGVGAEIPARLLVDGVAAGDVWTVTVVNTAAELDALWSELAVDLDMEPIDFTREVVIHFGPAESSSCPFAPLQAVRFDAGSGYLYPDLPIEGGPECTADANPHAVVVAVDRADLPTDAFSVWVANAEPPSGVASGVVRLGAGELAEPPSTDEPPTEVPVELPAGVTESAVGGVPSGMIEATGDDVVATGVDGDLWYHPGLLGTSSGEPFRLVDYGDPRVPVSEGPPPNQVEQVAGVYDGAVVFGDCCEPVSGNVFAVGGEDADRTPVVPGYTPVLDPGGTRLAAANAFAVTVIDLPSATQWTLMLDDDLGEGARPVDVWGVTWTDDGSALVLLTSDDDGYALTPLTGAVPLERGEPVPLDVEFDPTLTRRVTLAGVAADGAIAIAVVESDGSAATTVRFHDPGSLAEVEDRRIEFPATTSAVRVDGDEVMWVDDDTLWHRVADEAGRPLADEISAAWFVR